MASCVVAVMFLFSHFLGFAFSDLKIQLGVNDTSVCNTQALQEEEESSATNNARQHNGLFILFYWFCVSSLRLLQPNGSFLRVGKLSSLMER